MKRTIMAGMVLALTLGVASVSNAQQADRQSKPDSAHHDGHMKRGGGHRGMLLKGIDLTEAQKDQLKALHQKQGEVRREQREKMRGEMQEHHAKMLDEVRALLTPAQKEVFEKNVAEMQERMKTRHEHMKHRRSGERRS